MQVTVLIHDKEFNSQVNLAIDNVLCGLFGQEVLESIHNHLRDQYGMIPDELPYRLDTFFEILENLFGIAGAGTLTRTIAREIYYRFNIDYRTVDGYTLQDYVEQAKRILQSVHALQEGGLDIARSDNSRASINVMR